MLGSRHGVRRLRGSALEHSTLRWSRCRSTDRPFIMVAVSPTAPPWGRWRRERMSAPFLTLTEAAATLRLHPVTLRALAAAGELPGFKIGRAWRFVEIDLVAWARAHYRRADAVGDKEKICRSTNVQIVASGGPRSAYQTEVAYAALVAPRTGKKHRNGSITCAPISGASIASANAPRTRGRTP